MTSSGIDVPTIVLRGTPRECGRQYGVAARSTIGRTLDAYLDTFRRQHGMDRDQIFELARQFEPSVAEYDASLLDEMHGIAEGAEVPFAGVLAVNARSELVHGLKARLDDGCTSFCALREATGGATLIGQNWDWNPRVLPSTVVLDIRRDGEPRILTVTEAGLLGKLGMNDAGIGSCVNFLLSDTRRFGVPVHVIRRKILAATTLGDALNAVINAPRALSANYLVAHDSGEAIDIEAWPADVSVIHPTEGLLTHANHFRVPAPDRTDLGKTVFPDTLLRDARLHKLLSHHTPKIDVDTCENALQDHFNHPNAICRHLDPTADDAAIMTLGSIVMDLDERVLHLCSGPPCEGSYTAFPLT